MAGTPFFAKWKKLWLVWCAGRSLSLINLNCFGFFRCCLEFLLQIMDCFVKWSGVHLKSLMSFDCVMVVGFQHFFKQPIALQSFLFSLLLFHCCVPKSFFFGIHIIIVQSSKILENSWKWLRKIVWTSFRLIGLVFYNYGQWFSHICIAITTKVNTHTLTLTRF